MKSLATKHGNIIFSWKKTLWLYLLLFSIVFIDFQKISPLDICLVSLMTLLTIGVGHSVGLHRGIIHKSYTASKLFRNICLICFVLTGLGSPLSWLKQHYFRDFWQNRKDCPRYFRYQHSLFSDYIWNLHLTFTPKNLSIYNIPKDDLEDEKMVHYNTFWWVYYLVFCFLIYLFFGLNTMLLTTSFRTSLIILGHWYIGYASHKYGYAKHEILEANESGYNDIVLGLVSFGEGFHNNHHAFPASAKFSSRWYEIDFGWYLVWFLKEVRIISNVKTQDSNLKPTARAFEKIICKFPWEL